jgi:hypothetical protein
MTLTESKRAEIRERHIVGSFGRCKYCVRAWPCAAIRLLDENEKLRDHIGKMAAMVRGLDKIARAALDATNKEI